MVESLSFVMRCCRRLFESNATSCARKGGVHGAFVVVPPLVTTANFGTPAPHQRCVVQCCMKKPLRELASCQQAVGGVEESIRESIPSNTVSVGVLNAVCAKKEDAN